MGCFFWDDSNGGDALQLEIINGIRWVALALKGALLAFPLAFLLAIS